MFLDWISPLSQMLSGGESITVHSVAEIDLLKAHGIKVGTTPFEVRGVWVLKVDDAQRAQRILNGDQQPKQVRSGGLLGQPADWVCQHCGNRLPDRQRKCLYCGAPRG